VRNTSGLIEIEPTNFESVFDYLVPGSFIKFNTFHYWQVEKRIGDKLLVSFPYYRDGKVNVIKKLISNTEENVK